MNAPARRGLLAAFGGAALVPVLPAAALPAPDADAALIESCRLAVEAQDAAEAVYASQPCGATYEEAKPFERRAEAFLEVAYDHGCAALEVEAATLAGVLAKARAAFALVAKSRDGVPLANGQGDTLAFDALQDLLRLADPTAAKVV